MVISPGHVRNVFSYGILNPYLIAAMFLDERHGTLVAFPYQRFRHSFFYSVTCGMTLFQRSLLACLWNVRLFSTSPTAHNPAIFVETAELSVHFKIRVFLSVLEVSRRRRLDSGLFRDVGLRQLTAAKGQNGQVSMLSIPEARILASISICSNTVLDLASKKSSR